MDTSKKNIKMCEKAEEIQERDYENGDICVYKGKWGMYFKEYFYEEIVFNDGKMIDYVYPPIWLPRQDQLQEILCKNVSFGCPDAMVCCLKEFSDKDCEYKLETMEQLWLAFVMKEKYNKTWNGKDWILNDKR